MQSTRSLVLFIGMACVLAIFAAVVFSDQTSDRLETSRNLIPKPGVCPPFYLFTEEGDTINPLIGLNADKPYSPRQTCGKCHDYDLITEGFHFQQGKGEAPTSTMQARYQWVSHPGNYGGSWCSPAPLYNYLSPKTNEGARLMDMTSFSFITGSCGSCHPGGGAGEYDRDGKRYDLVMREMGYVAGGDNDFDGDYYKARWDESGVLEGDCMICHMPGYDNAEAIKQKRRMNLRWSATAGAGWAKVSGAVSEQLPIEVQYNLALFDAQGKLSPHIVREPRNENCLFCHAQPGWKKRGANYASRTDVHLRASMKCVDCHPAGTMAFDPRINQKEMHQIGKGDDPGGKVRDDLDNTHVTCNQCHTTGLMGAPIAKHAWLPALHLDRLACQSCHIPGRLVKPAQVQASDVFNPGTKISTPGKHLWVFYGPDMQYYNHYGNLEMMGYADKPTDPFRPILVRYKGQIRPANRVHSAWPGIEVAGKPGLMQPRMRDVYNMWQSHFKDASNYPELSLISDDNGDGVLEVNRPGEIDALISAVTAMLVETDYPMEGKRVVWAYNDRVYTSGTEYYTIDKELWEASPYANVHTFNHDVFPARAATGVNSCTECHAIGAPFFFANVLAYPFDEEGQPVYQPQYKVLGMTSFFVYSSVIREQFIKSLQIPVLLLLILILLVSISLNLNIRKELVKMRMAYLYILYFALFAGLLLVFIKPDLQSYILPERLWFDKHHFFFTLVAVIYGVISWLDRRKTGEGQSLYARVLGILLATAVASGVLMMVQFQAIDPIVRMAYTLYDLAVLVIGVMLILHLIKRQVGRLSQAGA